MQQRLTCPTPPPLLVTAHPLTTSPHPKPPHQTLSHSIPPMLTSPCSCLSPTLTLSHPPPWPTSSMALTSATQSSFEVLPSHSSKPLGTKIGSIIKSKISMRQPSLTSIRSWPSSRKRPGSTCHLAMKKMTASPCSPSTRVMVSTIPPSGSSYWTTVLYRPSLLTTAQEVLPTSITSMHS